MDSVFYALSMLVGQQITSRLCCKQITEGLREKFNKLFFMELSQNLFSVKKVADVQNFLN